MAFSYKATLTVDHTKVPTDQTDFPLLVFLTDTTLKTVGNGGQVQNASGYDIRFFSDALLTTALDFELVTYDGSAGTILFFVRLGTLSASVDNVLYIGFGNAALNTNGSTTSTWSSGYRGVLHCQDNAASTTVIESTGHVTATNTSNTSTITTTGLFGKALGFAGSNSTSFNTIPITNATMNNSTMESWVFVPSNSNNGGICYNGNAASTGLGTLVGNGTGASMGHVLTAFAGGVSVNVTGTSYTFTLSTWTHVTIIRSTTSTAIYINGVFQSGAAVTPNTPTDVHRFGGFTPWVGNQQEVRFSNVFRNTDGILASVRNQNSPGTFMSAVYGSNTDVSVAITGMAATGSAGALTETGTANVTPTGVAAAGTPGSLTVSADVTVSLSGVAAAASPGTLSVVPGVSVNMDGVSATGSPGAPSVNGTVSVSLLGRAGTTHAGTLAIPQSVSVHLEGVSAFGQSGVLFNSIVPDLLCCEGPYRLLSIFDARIPIPPPPPCSFADTFVRANGQVNLGQPLWDNKGALYPSIYSDKILLTGMGNVGYGAFVNICDPTRAYVKMTLDTFLVSVEATSGIVAFQSGIFTTFTTNHMNFYALRTGHDFTGWSWELDRYNNGSLNTLHREVLLGPQFGDFELRVEDFGTHVECNVYINGVLELTYTDSSGSRLAATNGFGMLGLGGTGTAEMYWSNFLCGEF